MKSKTIITIIIYNNENNKNKNNNNNNKKIIIIIILIITITIIILIKAITISKVTNSSIEKRRHGAQHASGHGHVHKPGNVVVGCL